MAISPDIDWSEIPTPENDGRAGHLAGMTLPSMLLASTGGADVDLASLPGLTVVYVYPKTGVPGTPLPEGWDGIPGARGCTPQSCAFRDHFAALKALGVDHLFGLSTQGTDYQAEAKARLALPFDLLSDASLAFARALDLPTFEAGGETLLKRMSLAIEAGRVVDVIYPVFPPDRNAELVEAWLRAR